MQETNKRLWLEEFDCFSISGKDAKNFLNGITTGNIINPDNNVSKTCWLTPNGVLRSIIEINFLEQKLEVIILEGNLNKIINYFNKIIFPQMMSLLVILSPYIDYKKLMKLIHGDFINQYFLKRKIKNMRYIKTNPIY